VEVSLIEGANGAFEITADGSLIFSKLKQRRFPAYREIPKMIDELLPLPPPLA
jgi:selT/selW/selH-like putative selenoprotein